MNTLPLVLFSDELPDMGPDDEIDDLFCQLEQIEPPTNMVESIMASVTMLSHTVPSATSLKRNEEEGLIVQGDPSTPS